MKTSRLSFLLTLAISLSACQAQLPSTSPAQGPSQWSDYQFAGTLVVKGKVSPPEAARSANVYLATADGTPLPGIFASAIDAQGHYAINRAPSNRTFLVVAEVTFQSGETAVFKTMARATDGSITADITQATTVATEWALQDRQGDLGGFNQEAFGHVVEKTYSLLATKYKGPRTLKDCIYELNQMAATDAYLKAAIEALKADLAATKLSLEETKKAVEYLKGRLKSAEDTLKYLGDAQEAAKKDITVLQTTTVSLQQTISNELKPQLNELKYKQDALSKEVYELKGKTEAEIAALKDKQDYIYKKLDEHKTYTQKEINDLNTELQVLYTKVDELKKSTDTKIADVKKCVEDGLNELKDMIEDLREDLEKETDERKESDAYLKAEIDKLEYAVDKVKEDTVYLKAAVQKLFGEVNGIKLDLNKLELLELLLTLLNGKICCMPCDDGGGEPDLTPIISRLEALENRDRSARFLSFGTQQTGETGDLVVITPATHANNIDGWSNLTGAEIGNYVHPSGRLVLMYEGATANSVASKRNFVRFTITPVNPAGATTVVANSELFVDVNQGGNPQQLQWTSIGTMAVTPELPPGTYRITLQGASEPDNGGGTASYVGKILAYSVGPELPQPTP